MIILGVFPHFKIQFTCPKTVNQCDSISCVTNFCDWNQNLKVSLDTNLYNCLIFADVRK